MKFQTLLGSSLAVAILAFSPGASAALLTSDNSTFNFSWSYFTGSYDLTGTGSMTVTGFNSSQLTIAITLNNTSPNTGLGGDRLTGFAFGIDPDATSVTFSDIGDGGMTSAGFVTEGAMVSNVLGVEICAWGGPNCSGGGPGGILAGASDSFSLLLGGTWGGAVTIDPIGLRYQTGAGSFTFASTSVPEPGSLVLLGLGIVGAGLARRRARRV